MEKQKCIHTVYIHTYLLYLLSEADWRFSFRIAYAELGHIYIQYLQDCIQYILSSTRIMVTLENGREA